MHTITPFSLFSKKEKGGGTNQAETSLLLRDAGGALLL